MADEKSVTNSVPAPESASAQTPSKDAEVKASEAAPVAEKEAGETSETVKPTDSVTEAKGNALYGGFLSPPNPSSLLKFLALTIATSPTGDTGEKDESKTTAEDEKPEQAATEVKAPPSAITEPGPNGTPASAKKGKRKSNAGVPEHRSKKLNRKKSQILTTHIHAEPGEYYFARLKGHPPWPAMICDEEMLPQALLTTRPVTAKGPDGKYREDFAEGGKRQDERTFPVMFMETYEL